MTQQKMRSHKIKRALISVSDKKGLIPFATGLAAWGIEIISTGGTSQALREANIPTRDVSDITNFPEIMQGRVKTLHPKIHGGILGQRDKDADAAETHHIAWIDLVIVNLYPFEETIKKPAVSFEEAIENIDIGGPSMIRSAAKNMDWVGVVVDPADYTAILSELQTNQSLAFSTRQALAKKAFLHTAHYDKIIYHYLNQSMKISDFPSSLTIPLEKWNTLRYGENPHQSACAYSFPHQTSGVFSAKQHQGKELSYNNLVDADAASACLNEFSEPTCVIVKHANPCGAASRASIEEAFSHAWEADALSAFGGIVALNRECTETIAEALSHVFIEVLIAPSYSENALVLLNKKPNLRVLEWNKKNFSDAPSQTHEFKSIQGGLLMQERDSIPITRHQLKIVTTLSPTAEDIETLLFTAPILKYVKSNAIVIAKKHTTVGIGAGQVSRVDAVDIALKKAGTQTRDAVLASDAFFPFPDGIERLAGTGIRAIMQPGGSLRDQEIIDACNKHHIAMVFTGQRCFRH